MPGRGFQIGTGVKVNAIDAIFDQTLESRLRLQLSSASFAQVDFRQWSTLESLLNEPGNGLSTDLSDLFDRISQLQTDPSQRSLRSGMVQSARSLTARAVRRPQRPSRFHRPTAPGGGAVGFDHAVREPRQPRFTISSIHTGTYGTTQPFDFGQSL